MPPFLLFLVALLGAPDGADAEWTRPPSEAARAAWGFDRSDLPPHPEVRFGALENGMRYAIMRSAAPPGAMSVRLHLDVGADVEGVREQGSMHLIEHLIFHGTPNIPEGSLPLMLAHRGLRRWTDFDAYTSYDETVFRLDMGKSDAAALNVSLLLMREIATNLQFDARTVRGAKRKVREEIAARDRVQDRIISAQNGFFLPGTPLARGPVAGTGSQVARARGDALRRLYGLYYVPQRTTLVLVGDFDPAAVEAEVAARFSNWKGSTGAEARRANASVARNRGTEARVFVDREAPTRITVSAAEPLGTPDGGGRRDAHFLEQLGMQILNRRLAKVASAPEAPFEKAELASYDHFATARLSRFDIDAKDRDWRRGLAAGARELRRAAESGFSQAELDEQLAVTRRNLVRAAGPARTPALADAILDAVSRRLVFTAPADNSGTDAYLARVQLANVNEAFKRAWSNPQRLIFLSHNRPVAGAGAAVEAVWSEAWLR